MSHQPGLIRYGAQPWLFEVANSTNAAQLLDPLKAVTNGNVASAAFITLETNDIRYRYDNGSAFLTKSTGHLLADPGEIVLVGGAAISRFRFISAATDAHGVLSITYYFDRVATGT